MKFQIVLLVCVAYCACIVKTQCVKKENKSSSIYAIRNARYERIISATIYCFNITSATIFTYNYQNETYRQTLIIDSETSNIKILDSNLSLSRFIGIKRLHMRKVGLEVITPGVFEGFNTLEVMIVSGNHLKKISNGTFNNLKNLKRLDLSGNSIEMIESGSFSGLLNLKILDLSHNKMTELECHLFKDLITSPSLDLSNNLIIELNCGNFPKLYKLDLSVNQISLVQNWEKFDVEVLILDNNSIIDVEIGQNIGDFSINRNKIVKLINTFPTNKSKALVYLDLSFNDISVIDSNSFRGLTKLNDLKLNNNKIEILHSNIFEDCSSLANIDLSHNQIRIIEPSTFLGINKIVANIDISHNNLKSLKSDVFTDIGYVLLVLDKNDIDCNDLKNLKNHPKIELSNFNYFTCSPN